MEKKLTEQEIAVAEREKQAMVATLRQRGAEAPAAVVASKSIVERFVTKSHAATTDAQEARTREARDLEAGMIAEARGLETRHAILKKKDLERVEAAAATDWPALMAATPEGLEFDKATRSMIPRSHDAIRRYRAAAESARDCLRSSFGAQQQGREIDPVNLAGAALAVEQAISSGTAHDTVDGVPSAGFRRAVVCLNWWVEKGRNLVASTEYWCKQFEAAETKLQEILAHVESRADAPAQKKPATIPDCPSRRCRRTPAASSPDTTRAIRVRPCRGAPA